MGSSGSPFLLFHISYFWPICETLQNCNIFYLVIWDIMPIFAHALG